MTKNSKNILDKIIIYLKNPLVWLSIIFLISVIILILMSRGQEKYNCNLKTHDFIPDYGCVIKCPEDKYLRCGKTCYDPTEQKCLEPDKLCDTCENECCSGSCITNPSQPDKKICCPTIEQVCGKNGDKCCGPGLICVNENCVPKCAPLDQATNITETIKTDAINLDGTISVQSNIDKWVNKMEVNLTSTGKLPQPIMSNTSYYIIRISDTQIKLANSLDNVEPANPIIFKDVGSTGSQITISSIIINRVCSPDEECYHMSNISKNSSAYIMIKNEMKNTSKIQEYSGVDDNHSDFYTCKVKPNCSYIDAPFAVPSAINNKYPSFNLQIPNGNTQFCSIRNANKDSSEDDAKYCFNTYKINSNLCNQDPKCEWYDLMNTNKDNVGNMSSAILKITEENDGLYCGKEGQRIFGKTVASNSQCSPIDCFIGIANSQTKQINYNYDTKTCVALLDSKKPIDGKPAIGNYQLVANNNQLQTIDISDTDSALKSTDPQISSYPYMPDCSETDKVNQLCSKTDSTYSFVSNSSEECQKDSGTLIQPTEYCGPNSEYKDGRCFCRSNGKKWNISTYVQDAEAIPGCTTDLCYEFGGKSCQKYPTGYCYGRTKSFLGNDNLNTDNPDCACNPAYKGKTCTTLVSMKELFSYNNIIPAEIAVEMIKSGIPINEGLFVLPGPGVEIISDINIQSGYSVDLGDSSGRPGIKDFLQNKWPAKWGCGQGYLFMNRDLFNKDINLYITGKNIYTEKTSFNHSYSNGNYNHTVCSPFDPNNCQIYSYHKFYTPDDERGGDGKTYGGNIVFFDSDSVNQAAVIIIGAT
jgi:hypothetical protein